MQGLSGARSVLAWYDFLCPFCYIGQHRNAILARHGLDLIELPFQAHPDIPPGGIAAAPRSGPMYEMLEREARAAGLPLNWPLRLPDTRRALASAEWVRQHRSQAFPQLHRDLFAAHFALGEDLGDPAVIDRHAGESGVDLPALHAALDAGTAASELRASEALGDQYDVRGTPSWWLGGRLIRGLLPAEEFEQLALEALQLPG